MTQQKSNSRKKKNVPEKKVPFSGLEEKVSRYQNGIFLFSLILLFLFGFLLFDIRVSEGGDDSAYLVAAKKFIDGLAFPGFHGTFYSMFIGVLIKILGFHLIFFKFLSLLFLAGHQTFFYLTFRKRVSALLLSMVLLIVAVSSDILYYGSQTYTEAMFMFLQAIFFYILITRIDNLSNDFKHIKSNWGTYLLLGLMFFMLATTRNVGMAALLTVILYLLFEKKYIPILYTVLSFVVVKFPYNLYKHIVWGITSSDLTAQIRSGMLKNPYNKALGTENFHGMMVRFLANAKIYLSGLFLQEIGLKDEKSLTYSLFWTLVIVLLLITGLVLAYLRKKKIYFSIFLYVGLSLGVTFISLSQLWSQSRLIIIYVPLLLLGLGWVLTELAKFKKLKWLNFITAILLIFIFFHNVHASAQKAKKNQEILTKNMSGDIYYGYAPDLRHFFQLSQWISENIPSEDMVMSRLAPMSFIYGHGRYFFPIYKVPDENVDTVLHHVMVSGKVPYVIEERKFMHKPMNDVLFLKKRLYAFVYLGKQIHGIYLVDTNNVPAVEKVLKQLAIKPITDMNVLKVAQKEKKLNPSAMIPDEFVKILKKNKVKFIIMGSIRFRRDRKTKYTINTVKRFMVIINLKYPGIFTEVKQFGANNDEPARLYVVNYKKYNL